MMKVLKSKTLGYLEATVLLNGSNADMSCQSKRLQSRIQQWSHGFGTKKTSSTRARPVLINNLFCISLALCEIVPGGECQSSGAVGGVQGQSPRSRALVLTSLMRLLHR